MNAIKKGTAIATLLILGALAGVVLFAQSGESAHQDSMSQLRAALEQVEPLHPSSVPEAGTFWMLNHYEMTGEEWPPFPMNPYKDAPVYAFEDGSFLVDDTFYFQMDRALRELETQYGLESPSTHSTSKRS